MAGQDGQQPPDVRAVAGLSTEIKEAELALALIDLSDFTFLSISKTALELYGLPTDAVVGRSAIDFVAFGEQSSALEALQALRSGAISFYVAHRELHAPVGAAPMKTEWLRAFDVGERRLALAQAATEASDDLSPIARYLGHEPTKMAIGTIDRDFTITAISRDIVDMLGVRAEQVVGQRVFDAVAHRDIGALLAAQSRVGDKAVGFPVHLRDQNDEWVSVCCLLTSLEGNPDRCFILTLAPDTSEDRSRVAELEQHLWQIAGILEASGVLRGFGPMRDMTALPQMNHLTMRQWEILTRLVRGERVPTIARDLHLSQSTVRNHLSVVFKRFGVRSQPELLKAIESAFDKTSA